MRCITQILSFFLLFFMLSLCQSQPAQIAPFKQCLIDRMDAISKRDTGNLNKTCTPDYRLISSSGSTYDLKELKKAIVASESQIKLSTIVSYQPFIVADESMAFAVCEIEENLVGENQKITKNNLIVTEIYRKEKGKWKIQLTHISQKICAYPG
jgi:hypothetical protein